MLPCIPLLFLLAILAAGQQEVLLLLGGQDGAGAWVQDLEVVSFLPLSCSLPPLPVQLYGAAALVLQQEVRTILPTSCFIPGDAGLWRPRL